MRAPAQGTIEDINGLVKAEEERADAYGSGPSSSRIM